MGSASSELTESVATDWLSVVAAATRSRRATKLCRAVARCEVAKDSSAKGLGVSSAVMKN